MSVSNNCEQALPNPVCDICFDEVARQDIYPQPCACNITLCWGCVHLQYVTTQKSQCPFCRQPNRYEKRYQIILDNHKTIWEKSSFAYKLDIDFIDNIANHQHGLDLKDS